MGSDRRKEAKQGGLTLINASDTTER